MRLRPKILSLVLLGTVTALPACHSCTRDDADPAAGAGSDEFDASGFRFRKPVRRRFGWADGGAKAAPSSSSVAPAASIE